MASWKSNGPSGCRASTSATSTWATTAGSATALASSAARPWATTRWSARAPSSPRTCRPTRSAPASPPASCGWGTSRRRFAGAEPAPLAADRPGGGAALREQLGRHGVLKGLGRLGRVAGAAEPAPGGARELVLAAVLARGRDRGRVAARLAVRGRPARGRAAARGPGRGRLRLHRRGGDAEAAERGRAGDAVDDEAVVALVVADRPARDGADHTVGGDTQRELERGRAGRARDGAGAAGRGAVSRDGAAGDEGHGREQHGAAAAAGALPPPLARSLHAAAPRGAERREPRARVRWIDQRHCYLLGLGAYGVSCRARAKTCATRRSVAIRPMAPKRRWVPRSPPPVLAGTRPGVQFKKAERIGTYPAECGLIVKFS